MAYRMKGTALYNKIAKNNFDIDDLEVIDPNAKVRKTKWYDVAEKLKVKKMNRKAKKKFGQ